jgi:polyhydroxyalkanoate synthase
VLRPNAFVHGGPVIDGRRRSLADVRCPTLVVMATEDYVVPLDAAAPLTELLGGEVTELRLPFGHVGLVAGRAAATRSIPAMLDWIAEH